MICVDDYATYPEPVAEPVADPPSVIEVLMQLNNVSDAAQGGCQRVMTDLSELPEPMVTIADCARIPVLSLRSMVMEVPAGRSTSQLNEVPCCASAKTLIWLCTCL